MLTEGKRDVAWEITRWAVVLAPSLILSSVLALWLQWLLPQEDDLGIDRVLYGLMLSALWFAFVNLDGLKPLWRRSIVGATVVIALPWLLLPLFFVVMSPFFVVPVMAGLAIVFGAYRVSTALAGRTPRSWRQPIAASLCVLLCSFTLFGSPMLASYKWCWPWWSFRQEVQARVDEKIRLGDETEFTVAYRFPIINKNVSARVQVHAQTRPEYIQAYWGRRQFGPLNLRTGWILWASD